MLVRYWHPWREIDTLRRQFDQMFDSVVSSDSSDWAPAVPSELAPPIELKDTGNELVVRAQLPGIDATDIDVQVTRNAVFLAGEHRQEQRTEEHGLFRTEFRYGKFQRVIPLPAEVQNDQVKAEFKEGILSLTLPKVEQPKVVKLNLVDTAGSLEAGAEAPQA